MNRFKHIFLSLLTLVCSCQLKSYSQNTVFFKTLSGAANFNDATVYLDTLSASEFIAGGPASWLATSIYDTLTYDSYLLRHHKNGILFWLKRYHYSKRLLRFYTLDVLKDKNILVGGSSNTSFFSFTAPNHGVLMLADQNGNVFWSKAIPWNEVTNVKELSTENKIIILEDTSGISKILMFDKYFNFKWGTQLPSLSNTGTMGIIEGKDQSILLLGNSFGAGKSFMILMDSLGNIISGAQAPWLNNNPQYVISGFKNKDIGFYICGAKAVNGNALRGFLMKVDNQLNVKWYKEYDQSSNIGEFLDITKVTENNFLIMGEPEGPFSVTKYSNPIFTDSNGFIRRSYYFMSDSFATLPTKLILLPDGKILFNSIWAMTGFGITDTINNSFCGSKNVNWWLADSVSNFSVANFPYSACSYSYQNINIIAYTATNLSCVYPCITGPFAGLEYGQLSDEDLVVYPVPAGDFITIKYNGGEKNLSGSFERFYLLNNLGEMVFSSKLHYNESSIRIDVSCLASGIYTLVLKTIRDERVFKKISLSRE